jgi:hypothetical protein
VANARFQDKLVINTDNAGVDRDRSAEMPPLGTNSRVRLYKRERSA